MARAATSSDVFNAVAEPRRRQIVEVLARAGAQPVGAVVGALRLPQPVVSKHLGVLRKAGVVSVTRRGRERIYALEGSELRTMHEWVKRYESFWMNQLSRIKARAEARAADAVKKRTEES
jgi:DNA-binding transcriptional ArsR family regulator